jgi:hypothetical protein
MTIGSGIYSKAVVNHSTSVPAVAYMERRKQDILHYDCLRCENCWTLNRNASGPV